MAPTTKPSVGEDVREGIRGLVLRAEGHCTPGDHAGYFSLKDGQEGDSGHQMKGYSQLREGQGRTQLEGGWGLHVEP